MSVSVFYNIIQIFSAIKFELVQHGHKRNTTFSKGLLKVTYLGGALCTATLYDFLDFVHK